MKEIMRKTLCLIAVTGIVGWFTTSKAAIVYTNITDVTVNATTTSATVDFNNDATPEISFTWSDPYVTTMTSPTTNPILDFVTWAAYPAADWDVFKNVPYGTVINSASGFYTQGDCSFNPGWQTAPHTLATNTDLYIGVKFSLSSVVYYGWVRVNIASGTGYVTIKDYAYENVAGTGIAAGSTTTTSIHDINSVQINAFVNPTTNNLIISTNDNDLKEIVVYNITGSIVLKNSFSATTSEIDLSKLVSGNYIVTIKSAEGSISRKIFKN